MIEESISNFIIQVRSLVDSVSKIENPSFQKVLYLVMIDGLSTHRFPDYRQPGNRFVGFLNTYGGWPDCDRISLPQADLLLHETKEVDPALKSAVSDRLAQWQESNLYNVSEVDPFARELPDPTGILRDCQHGRLLWALRNTLLHEFRRPAYGLDMVSPERTVPYYHQYEENFDLHEQDAVLDQPLGADVDRRAEDLGVGASGVWELVIPAKFLRDLALHCLEGLAAWLLSERIDPSSIGYQGRSWVTKLRKLNY